MLRILSLSLLATAAFAQVPQSRWSSVQLVPGLRDRLALRTPAVNPAVPASRHQLIQEPHLTQPCSIPLLSMDIPKDVKFHLRHKKPPAQTRAQMPQANVAKACPEN